MTGQLYATGGYDNDETDRLPNLSVADVNSGTLKHAPPMKIGRCAHTTATTASSLFVFGGENKTGLLSSCEEFDTQTMK